jgi:hypothetical protein
MSYFESSSVKVIPDLEQSFLPDTSYTTPAVGDPVYISADNKVSLCTGANAAFVGFVQNVAVGGNKILNVYTFGHRVRAKNTSGVTLNAGDIITSGNAGISKLAALTNTDLETTGADTTKIANAINAQRNRRGIVVVGGANNAVVQIIFG